MKEFDKIIENEKSRTYSVADKTLLIAKVISSIHPYKDNYIDLYVKSLLAYIGITLVVSVGYIYNELIIAYFDFTVSLLLASFSQSLSYLLVLFFAGNIWLLNAFIRR